jgi:hypothetical protein
MIDLIGGGSATTRPGHGIALDGVANRVPVLGRCERALGAGGGADPGHADACSVEENLNRGQRRLDASVPRGSNRRDTLTGAGQDNHQFGLIKVVAMRGVVAATGLVVAAMLLSFAAGAGLTYLVWGKQPERAVTYSKGYVRFTPYPGKPNEIITFSDVRKVIYHEHYVEIECIIAVAGGEKHTAVFVVPRERLLYIGTEKIPGDPD